MKEEREITGERERERERVRSRESERVGKLVYKKLLLRFN